MGVSSMKLGIMQPYFLPYIGYFHLLKSVDIFIIYDNIKYTKKGWINRNRFLLNGSSAVFSLPLKNSSDTLNVLDRELVADFDRRKLLNKFKGAYIRAPYFRDVFPFLEKIILNPDNNLFNYIYFSVVSLCERMEIDTKILVSSDIPVDHSKKGQDKIFTICQALCADIYINPIGGIELYSKEIFADRGVTLQFIKSLPLSYPQFGNEFVSWLSIIDVLMFNHPRDINQHLLTSYELV